MNKTMLAILKVLDRKPDEIMGSREISRQLTSHGIDLTERTVRYHLRILDEKGLTAVYGKEGRKITPKGREEVSQSHVSEKVGFVITRIEALSYLSDLDLAEKRGRAIMNISLFPEEAFGNALQIMKSVFESPYSMSTKVAVARAGESIGDIGIPDHHVGFGTLCSVTINSILLKAGIPVTSKFGGVLQIENGAPSRFVALISYAGSSLDPLEIFIKSSMTDVRNAIQHRSGKILASFREIPHVCVDKARELDRMMKQEGLGGMLAIGNPNQDLLEMPVSSDKAGMVVVGGLNPVAIAEESGIPTKSIAMSTLYEYALLRDFEDILKENT